MRSKQSQKNLPVTARSLETLIRLASAHAKTRLSISVDDEDVEVAVELMNFVLFHEIGDAINMGVGPGVGADSRGNLMSDLPRGKKIRGGGPGSAPQVSDEDEENGEHSGQRGKRSRLGEGSSSSSATASSSSNEDDYNEYANENYEVENEKENRVRENILLQEIVRYSQDQEVDTFLVDEGFMDYLKLFPSVYTSLGSPLFPQIVKMLSKIDTNNKVMKVIQKYIWKLNFISNIHVTLLYCFVMIFIKSLYSISLA